MSVEIEIDISDYEIKINRLVSGLPEFIPRMMIEGSKIIEEEMKSSVPVKTGFLRDSISSQVDTDSAVISTNSGYGKFVDEDTAPHIIRGNPFLRFEINGQEFIRRQINHPGTKGQHFREKTMVESIPKIQEASRALLNEVLQ